MLALALAVTVAAALMAAPATASEQQPAGGGERYQKVVAYVISDAEIAGSTDRLVRELRRHGDLDRFGISPATSRGPSALAQAEPMVDEPATYVTDSGRFPRGRNPDDVYRYTNHDECEANAGRASDDAGWIKNRYSYCQMHTLLMPAFDCGVLPPRCRLTGVFESQNMLIGYGKVGGWEFYGEPHWRYANFFLDVDVRRSTGQFNRPGASLTVSMQCDGTYVSPAERVNEDNACIPGPGSSTKRPPKRWRQDDTAEFSLGSEALAPSGKHGEQLATGEFHLEYDFELPGYWQGLDTESPDGGMRFDSAWYLTRAKKKQLGSVFDRAVPGFAYSLSDDKVAGVGAHIFDARTRPHTTIPQQEGKVLPGASPADPIHRLAKAKSAATRERYEANEKVTRRGFCRSAGMPPKPRDGGPFDCDEYSFASTYEGAARYQYDDGGSYYQHYSVRWVNRDVNQEAGRRLAGWYRTDRILDEEAFFVPITQ